MAKTKSNARWSSVQRMVLDAAAMLRPNARMTVSEWAANKRWLDTPGAYTGPWLNDSTPYLNEVMDTLTSLEHTGCVLAGPARSGKSDIVFNWIGHSLDCDPADMRIYLQTKFWAEDWSQGDLERTFAAHPPGRGSPFKKHMLPGKHNNTLLRKRFISGMRLNLSWPAITELSGKTVGRTAANDYDHMEQNINGMGPAWPMMKKRTTTFRQFGMSYAESTPAFGVTDPNWIATSLHQAPPVASGILTLYNTGDRRRWYWRCPDDECRESFEPSFDLFVYDMDAGSNAKIAKTVEMACPCCGFKITEDMRPELNRKGRWLKDGETMDRDGVIHGEGEKNDIASFWLKGPAAFMQSWTGMVLEYLNAMAEYENSGKDGPLRLCYELSRGEPYVQPRNDLARLPETLKERAEDWGSGITFETKEPTVPPWVRFLVATVDVQLRSFVVQITGIGEGNDVTVVDMFKIRKSNRIDKGDKRLEHHQVDPAGYLEDWDLLIDEVIERTYPLADGSGRRMAIKISGCDSGGREGVTANAYQFYRRLRDDTLGRQHHRRFHLIKGEPSKSAPRRKTETPDSKQKGPNAIARGDVPVQFLNSNSLKDQVNAILSRVEEGARMRFPTWAPNFFYQQMCAEERTSKGWENKSGRRNEAWDLTYYCIGLCLHPDIRLEHIKWDDPERVPGWAKPWDQNLLVIKPLELNPIIQVKREPVKLLEAAEGLI